MSPRKAFARSHLLALPTTFSPNPATWTPPLPKSPPAGIIPPCTPLLPGPPSAPLSQRSPIGFPATPALLPPPSANFVTALSQVSDLAHRHSPLSAGGLYFCQPRSSAPTFSSWGFQSASDFLHFQKALSLSPPEYFLPIAPCFLLPSLFYPPSI